MQGAGVGCEQSIELPLAGLHAFVTLSGLQCVGLLGVQFVIKGKARPVQVTLDWLSGSHRGDAHWRPLSHCVPTLGFWRKPLVRLPYDIT